MSIPAAIWFFLGFGILTVIGGSIGFFVARSLASLVAGAISGGLLIAASVLLMKPGRELESTGAILALVVSLALVGRFLPAMLRGKKNPAIYMAPLSVIGAIVAVFVMLTLHRQ